jgi:hypothetical protein
MPTVDIAPRTANQSLLFQAGGQLDGGVMPDLQPLGEIADRGFLDGRQTLDRSERLMLLRFKACCAGSSFAEIQELADFVPEIGQRAIKMAKCAHNFSFQLLLYYIALRY